MFLFCAILWLADDFLIDSDWLAVVLLSNSFVVCYCSEGDCSNGEIMTNIKKDKLLRFVEDDGLSYICCDRLCLLQSVIRCCGIVWLDVVRLVYCSEADGSFG
jgi:hypothetical protein